MNETNAEDSWDRAFRPPYVTYILCALCGLVFFLQTREGAGQTSGLAYPGYVDGYHLCKGEYWGLLSSFFIHAGLAHVAFNLYWLYLFGSAVEPYIGWQRFLLFWFAGTAFSSMAQFTFCGETGIGASGFVYALFGLIWVGSWSRPYLARVLNPQTVVLFVIWLFVCIFLTWSGTMNVGNGAHVGGFLFGAICAYSFLICDELWLKRAVVVITVLSFLPLFYAPWLDIWKLAQAGKAYDQGKYERTLDYLQRVNLPEYEVYAIELRGDSLAQLGRSSEAAAVYRGLLSMDRNAEIFNPSYVYNEYAWILATSPDDHIRNSTDAIHYAQMACDNDGYNNSDDLDTLAAAYASANQFDQAVSWEQKAIAADTDAHGLDELKMHLKLFESQKPYRQTAGKSAGGGT